MSLLPDPSCPLEEGAAAEAFAAIFDGKVSDEALASFLTTLADRGETVGEVVAAARALRARAIQPFRAADALDVCGTGGDGMHSLNISTAVSLVVAACGVKLAKHGNRAASSTSGAADVLMVLGVPELPMDRLGPCLDKVGITFLHAARHHPAMARVAPVRRALGRRTIFNLLGPLCNPAGVDQQLLGVFAPGPVPLMAEALQHLGSRAALVVHGQGFDEVALSGETHAVALTGGALSAHTITPEAAGLPRQPNAALKGGSPDYNAERLKALLAGQADAYRDMVLLNAAAALGVVRPGLTLPQGVAQAAAAIDSGAAADILARWIAFR
ncbi:anthranilate phosphoribosyltransferase [Sandarakinorhabdus sp. AAP62]|uniref:anthranilate phosphoribosyltransferase n=1 Tax=Sandarakinorhabdus sp. AAP62 TaxID=1248916 RepID=UPI0002D90C48|nr:anthranilate phosphoribosyltransferase [Sandarakinorhabdus sp. AAP62]